jgi:hypothetical protein
MCDAVQPGRKAGFGRIKVTRPLPKNRHHLLSNVLCERLITDDALGVHFNGRQVAHHQLGVGTLIPLANKIDQLCLVTVHCNRLTQTEIDKTLVRPISVRTSVPILGMMSAATAALLHLPPAFTARLFQLSLRNEPVTIAVHPIKCIAAALALRDDTISVRVQSVEMGERFFGSRSRCRTHLVATEDAITIAIHSHLGRIASLRRAKLIEADHTVAVCIHLLKGLDRPVRFARLVTVIHCHSGKTQRTSHC